ncbi:DUF4349 domain-containing protein [Methylocystis sp. IM4]|uniref:DUF4349 domain-containing protein n=1 Tax=Methylocystis sp. IM4 TaxID=3136560 RepID=UPI0031196C9D
MNSKPLDLKQSAAILKIALLSTALAGCLGEQGADTAPAQLVIEAPSSFAGGRAMPAARATAKGQFAYTHELSIAVAPRFVSAHFERAKTMCLEDRALRCILLDASTNANALGPSRPNARLQLRLPHESVDHFSKVVTSPVKSEDVNDLTLIRSATRLDDLGRPIADTKRRLEQLENYRERLKSLEARTDTRVEDLIKIANELSQTQSRIEEIDEQRRRLEERVETELLDLSIQSETPAGGRSRRSNWCGDARRTSSARARRRP